MFYNPRPFERLLKRFLAKQAGAIKKLIDDASDEVSFTAASQVKPKANEDFFFKNYPKLSKGVDAILHHLSNQITKSIQTGIEWSWDLANAKNDGMLEYVVKSIGAGRIPQGAIDKWAQRNLDALASFQGRKVAGMNLSERVWNYTKNMKGDLELALDLGLGEGKSADSLSREVRRFLNEPDRLYRRVRDEKGVLRLSKSAANYHPGQGVYRSSYKNAKRLAATETNMAYRTSDFERTQQMDFILGVEVHLSNNHTCLNAKGVPEPFYDICDELEGRYPKDFKFVGWHPLCRCYSTTILPSKDEFMDYVLAMDENGDSPYEFKGHVEDTPPQFKKWIADNEGRIESAKSVPYFIKDNQGYVDEALGKPSPVKITKTPEYAAGKALLGELGTIPDVDVTDMRKALDSGDLDAIRAESEKLARIKSDLNGLSYVDDGFAQAQKWGYQPIMTVEKSVAAKIDGWSSLSLEQQAAKLDFEANKYLGGNMVHKATGKHVQELYPTWQVSQKAYLKELAAVQDKIEWNTLNDEFKALSKYKGGEPYLGLQSKASDALAAKDKSVFKTVLSDMKDFQNLVDDMGKALNFSLKSSSAYIDSLFGEFSEAMNAADIAKAKKVSNIFSEWETLNDKWKASKSALSSFSYFNAPGLNDKLLAAYNDALGRGALSEAKAIVAGAESWKDILPAYKDAVAYKSKSSEYKSLLSEFQHAVNEGDLALAKQKQAEVAEKRAQIDKGRKYYRSNKKSGESPFAESYSQERKEKAVWDTAEKAAAAGYNHGKVADETLFDSAAESWKAAIDKEKKANALINQYKMGDITRTELETLAKQKGLPVYAYDEGYGSVKFMTQREAMYEYTHHYCDVNEPLELRSYGNHQSIEKFVAKTNAMTDYLETCATPKDMWFQRGDNDMSAVLGRLEFNGQSDKVVRDICSKSISSLETEDLKDLVGKKMKEGGFMSTGSGKRKGFDESCGRRVIINIFAPEGSHAMYAEHFSEFGAGVKSASWDGTRASRYFSDEFETIFQRGTEMRITKAEVGYYEGRKIVYLDVEIIGQDVKDISYVPKSKITAY